VVGTAILLVVVVVVVIIVVMIAVQGLVDKEGITQDKDNQSHYYLVVPQIGTVGKLAGDRPTDAIDDARL
jgi:flagellar basal body-associated protein FliL